MLTYTDVCRGGGELCVPIPRARGAQGRREDCARQVLTLLVHQCCRKASKPSGGRIVLNKKNRVCFGYRPVRLILKDVDLTLSMSSRVALVGPNGAGMLTHAGVC
jgi:ATPase subunit of ABC transporter with duplicated ATPase domains